MPDNDRWRNDRERYRHRDDRRRDESDWGSPRGRREDDRGGGFGRTDSWYAAGNGDYRPTSDRDERERYRDRGFGGPNRGPSRRTERDYGDSAGYGTGGSALDWRDVMEDERGRRDRDRTRGREPGFTDLAFGHGFGSGYEGRDYSGEGRGRDRDRSHGRGRESDDRGFFERAGDEIASWFGDDEATRRRRQDEHGGHRGRGPKGYQRSDERIRDDVNDRLTEDPHIDASEIEVTVSGREVTLTGTVSSRFEKRHAEDLAESVSGITHVQNNLRVQQGAGIGVDAGLLGGGGMGAGGGSGAAGGSTTSTGSAGALGGTDLSRSSGATRRTTET